MTPNSEQYPQSINTLFHSLLKYQAKMAALTNSNPLVDQYEPEWANEEMELHAWDNQDTSSMFCAIM
jgi:hypothetical protein